VVSINLILAFIGFVTGAIIGMALFALVMGERRANYRLLAARHPWVRLVFVLWIVTCGAAGALVAYALAG
jgi:hypothetical protein